MSLLAFSAKFSKVVILGLTAISMVACGGGGGGGGTITPVAPSTSLSGTAAAGAPIIGTVTVKGSLGNTKSALIEANGNYDVDVSGLTAPYRLRAQGTVGGRTYKLHSYAVADDIGKNVNITPFTDLIVANVAGQIAESYFDNNNVPELTAAEIDEQETELQEKLKDVFAALGVDTAIDLLNSTFSADHSGLDAALDIVRVEVNAGTNIATITNLVENTSIQDSVTITGETDTLVVNDPTKLGTTATDTQAIAQIFDAVEAAFANGLPTQASIQDYFADDFIEEDNSKDEFLTNITTDPGVIGLMFSGITVTNLDSTVGTAEVTFSFGLNGVLEVNPEKWFVAKHATLGWQVRGDQRIVETEFNFHCNHYDAADTNFPGACGLNTQLWDNDFSNNGTNGAAIASGTVKIIDQTDSSIKATIYLGTPPAGTAGDVQAYSAQNQNHQGDYIGFDEVSPAIFVPGDTIEYAAYTADLDLSNPAAPAVTGTPIVTYTDTILFAPENVLTKMPTATDTTKMAISNFTLGNDLTVAWNLVAGTRIEEVLVRVTDSAGNKIEIWDWMLGTTATSKTFSSSSLNSTAASTAGLLSTDTTYSLKVRIYAADIQTGQSHSRDYNATIPGPAATGGTGGTSLACGHESGWDDTADGGLGAPINPNSFADFESVVADCGTAITFTAASVAGNTYNESPELTTFNVFTGNEAGTVTNPGSGQYNDTTGFILDFKWYVETASAGHSYLVLYTDSSLDADLPTGYSMRETAAITGAAGTTYTFKTYSEGSNYGDLDRAVGSDGEIWTATRTQQ